MTDSLFPDDEPEPGPFADEPTDEAYAGPRCGFCQERAPGRKIGGVWWCGDLRCEVVLRTV